MLSDKSLPFSITTTLVTVNKVLQKPNQNATLDNLAGIGNVN